MKESEAIIITGDVDRTNKRRNDERRQSKDSLTGDSFIEAGDAGRSHLMMCHNTA